MSTRRNRFNNSYRREIFPKVNRIFNINKISPLQTESSIPRRYWFGIDTSEGLHYIIVVSLKTLPFQKRSSARQVSIIRKIYAKFREYPSLFRSKSTPNTSLYTTSFLTSYGFKFLCTLSEKRIKQREIRMYAKVEGVEANDIFNKVSLCLCRKVLGRRLSKTTCVCLLDFLSRW